MAASRPRKSPTKIADVTSAIPRFMGAPAERWQHNDREPHPKVRDAIQRPQRLRTIAGTLLASGRIGGAEHAATARWVRDYELGHHHARDPESIGSGTGSPDGIPIAICDALSRDREATLALGSRGTAVMILIGHRSISLSALARHLAPGSTGKNVDAATRLVIETLAKLADHYAGIDKRGPKQRQPWADHVPAHLRPGYRAASDHRVEVAKARRERGDIGSFRSVASRAALPPHPFNPAPAPATSDKLHSVQCQTSG